MNATNNFFSDKISYFKGMMNKCLLCPRRCGIDRNKGLRGACGAGYLPSVYSYQSHRGEEPPISGTRGSGTIFFSHCNMSCVYCQNAAFSKRTIDDPVSIDRLAQIMIDLQDSGCHNINLVSPTHFVPQIYFALITAKKRGLSVPIVYNTGGYDSEDVIKALEGVIDIYMPDMRYADDWTAKKFSGIPDYVENNRKCVLEMQKQVGTLKVNEANIAVRGLIIRCLVLPGNISGVKETLRFIKSKISENTFISMMSQYYPTYRAGEFDEINRKVTNEEYGECLNELSALALNNGWIQSMPASMNDEFGGHRIKQKKGKKHETFKKNQ